MMRQKAERSQEETAELLGRGDSAFCIFGYFIIDAYVAKRLIP